MLRLVLLFSLFCSAAFAQVNPGTSPLSGKKGGTNNAFMQFTGPATAMKTYALPNASDTLAALGQIQTWTGAQSFSDGKLILLGATSGSSTIKAPATGGGTATLFSGSDTVVGLAAAQTLTNKTLTSPAISGPTFSGTALGTYTLGGTPTIASPTITGSFTATGLVTYADLATGTQDTLLGYFGSTTVSAVAPGNCLNALTYSTSTHSFGCNTTAGTGTVTSAQVSAGAGITVTTTSGANPCVAACNLTVAQSLTNAVVTAYPTGTSQANSSTQLMFGFGSVCKITPVYSGRVRVTIQAGSVLGSTALRNLRYGTGTAPSSGGTASTSGTALWTTPISLSAQSATVAANYFAIATGLTVGTQYWFDASGTGSSAGNDVLSNPICIMEEF